jgi:hypothetical protein
MKESGIESAFRESRGRLLGKKSRESLERRNSDAAMGPATAYDPQRLLQLPNTAVAKLGKPHSAIRARRRCRAALTRKPSPPFERCQVDRAGIDGRL